MNVANNKYWINMPGTLVIGLVLSSAIFGWFYTKTERRDEAIPVTASAEQNHKSEAVAPPAMINVPGGVYRFGTEEVYLDPFSIAKFAVPAKSEFKDEDSVTCDFPTMYEYLVAAKLPEFTISNSFESIEAPPEDECNYSAGELDAEGVTGNVYFAGIGSKTPTDGFKYVRGGRDPKDSISFIDSNIFYFWDDDYKPSPRSWRCVERPKVKHFPAFTKGANVRVHEARDIHSKTRMKLRNRARVKVVYAHDGWSFIEGKGAHGCQKKTDWDVFEDRGWVLSTLLRK